MLTEASRALGATEAFLKRLARELALRGTFEDALTVVARFGILAASLVREERPRGTLEMTQALSAAFWTMQAERDDAVLGATPPGSSARASSKKGGPNGETIEREQRASYDERHRMSVSSTTTARQERLAFADMLLRREKGRREGLGQNADAQDALAQRVEVLIAAEQENAQRWRRELAEKSATVEPSEGTDTRGTVTTAPSAPSEPLRSGPARSDSPVATSAPVAAPQPASATSSPAPASSAPGGGQAPASTWREVSPEEALERDLRKLCATWIANSGRKTVQQAQACVDAQTEVMAILRSRYRRGQDAERKWKASGARGRVPVPAIVIPWPASKWWREHDGHGAEAHYSERQWNWVLEPEPKEQKR